MKILSIGPLKHLIILGACDFSSAIEEACLTHHIYCSFITGSDQKSHINIQDKNNILVTDTLKDGKVSEFIGRFNIPRSETLSLSFGARWIFDKQSIEEIFSSNLINAHGARLPFDRGGGGFSWRIMRGDRIGQILLHKIDEGIDTGDILYSSEYVIPRQLRTPLDIHKDYMERLQKAVLNLLSSIVNSNVKYELKPQSSAIGTYLPRLSTAVHGWIDWSWTPYDIEKFINAFESPYSGAGCYLKGSEVRIKKVQLHNGEIGTHPFQSGLVTRKNQDWFIVSLKDGYALIVEDIKDSNGMDMMGSIKEGDRLYTPSTILDTAYAERVVYTSAGKKDLLCS